MIKLIIGIFVIVFIVLFVRRGIKGRAHTLETIGQSIKDLLRRGYDGGFLIIDIASSKHFLQLRKYINKPGDYGIELSFPKVEWSLQFFDELKDFCNSNELEFNIASDDINGPVEFLYIDFEKNHQKAHEYIKRILLEVFRTDKDVKLFVRLENATIEDKLIDSNIKVL